MWNVGLDEPQAGIKIARRNISNLRYADDTTLMAESREKQLEKEMATNSSVLAWRIPGTGEPGGLPSMGSPRVRHDWSDLAVAERNRRASWWGWKRRVKKLAWNSTLKQNRKTDIMASGPHFMTNRRGKSGSNDRFYFLCLWVCLCFVNKFICIILSRFHV